MITHLSFNKTTGWSALSLHLVAVVVRRRPIALILDFHPQPTLSRILRVQVRNMGPSYGLAVACGLAVAYLQPFRR